MIPVSDNIPTEEKRANLMTPITSCSTFIAQPAARVCASFAALWWFSLISFDFPQVACWPHLNLSISLINWQKKPLIFPRWLIRAALLCFWWKRAYSFPFPSPRLPIWDSVVAAFARLIQLVSAMPVSLGCAMQMLHTDGTKELYATTQSHLGLTRLSPGSARISLPSTAVFYFKKRDTLHAILL